MAGFFTSAGYLSVFFACLAPIASLAVFGGVALLERSVFAGLAGLLYGLFTATILFGLGLLLGLLALLTVQTRRLARVGVIANAVGLGILLFVVLTLGFFRF